MRVYLLLLLAVCISTLANAQDAFQPVQFKDVVQGLKNVKESETNFLQYYIDSVGEVKMLNSFKTRFIKKGKYKGQDCLFVIQKYQSPRGKNFDTAIVNPVTLQPIEYHSNISSGNYKEHAVFANNKIKLRIEYKDSTVEKEYDNAENVFLFTSEREVISSLPLKPGYAAIFKLVNTGVRQQVIDAYAKVLGEETLNIDNQKIEVYRVGLAYTKAPENNNYPTILLVTKNQHEVIKHLSSRFGFIENKLF